MTDAGASGRRLIVITGLAVLAIAIASYLTISFTPGQQGVTLLLAYAGGTAMLLTP